MITTENVMGVKTDTFHLTSQLRSSTASPRKVLHIFFIAGNPGTLHFYIKFLQKLFSGIVDSPYFELYDKITCHGVGHANHHLEGSSTSKAIDDAAEESQHYNLEFQICHKLAFIASVLDDGRFTDGHEISNPEVMMIGHSIGSYMLIDALDRCKQLVLLTKYIILLMPFISWSHLPYLHRAKLSSFLALHPMSHRFITSLAAPLLRMSKSSREKLLRQATGLRGEVLSTVANGLMNKRLLNNFLEMGADEIRDVKAHQKRMLLLLEELDKGEINGGKDIFILYTDNDEWAAVTDAKILQERLKTNTTVAVEPDLTHAFSLTELRVDRTCSLIIDHFATKKGNLKNDMKMNKKKLLPTRTLSKL